MPIKTQILYQDQDILVCHKPVGLAVESSKIGQMDMVHELKNYLKSPYLGVVHRLDQPVEGLLVFAQNQQAAAKLSAQLQANILNKSYYAVVCGQPPLQQQSLVDYLIKNSKNHRAVIGQKGQKEAKEARLSYQLLETVEKEEADISLLKIQIETGRFHQIRAQLANSGFPILGDQKYGTIQSIEVSRRLSVKTTALCAFQISFEHPRTQKLMEFEICPEGIFSCFSTGKNCLQ